MDQAPRAATTLLNQIRRLRKRWRLLTLVEGVGIALAAVFGVFLGAAALDNWLHLPWVVRLIFLIAFIASAIWLFFMRVIVPLRQPYTDEAVAVHLEGRIGDRQNRIINSVQLGRLGDTGHRETIERALAENTDALQKGPPLERALPVKRAAQWLGAFVVIALVIVAYAKLFPKQFGNATARLTRPLANIQPITDTTLEVKPGSMEVPMGGIAEVHIITGGKAPNKVTLSFSRGGDWQHLELSPSAPNKYAHTFLDVRSTITYSVRAGDARSERYRIRAVEGPDVAGITVTYHYPDWTGLSDKTEKEGHGDVLAPAGSKVRLDIRANRALARAEITLPDGNPVALKSSRPESFQWEGLVEQNGDYRLAFVDTRGFKNTLAIERDFKVQPDRLPTIELKPKEDIALTSDQPQSLTFTAEDDFGVREVRLLAWKKEGDAPKVLLAQPGTKTQHNIEKAHTLNVTDLGTVGETWTVVAEATDFNPEKDRKPARSQPLRVRLVATRDLVDAKLLAAAELKRGLAELIQLQQANVDICKTIAPDFEADKITKWSDAAFATLTMKHFENAATNQIMIHAKTVELAKKVEPGVFNGIRDALDGLAQRDMVLASEHLTQGLAITELTERREKLQASLQVQTVILETLKGLLEQASNLETEIALQTIVAGLEKILGVEQDLVSKTPPNAQPPDAAGTTKLADRQKEASVWLADLQKRLDDTTARLTAEKIAAAKAFVDLNAACKAKNIPPAMQAAETALRASQWSPALQAETQVVDSLQSLLAMIRSELAKVAESIASSLREELKKAPVGTDAQASIYKALKTAEALAQEGAEKKAAASKQTNVPERPIGDEMTGEEISKYLKRLQDAAKQAEQAKAEIKNADWNNLEYQQKMAASHQENRDPKEIDPNAYHLTPGKDSPRNQDWSKFEGARGGPKAIKKDAKPDMMEDLIGDLIDQQERLREKMITSFMEMNMDMPDTGNVADMEAPMGNYAMRGKTGNKMPASLNIGGRSRSGRQGPTFGELGMDKAKDMKGRPGEGLNAPDQKGFVRDEKVEGDPGADPTTATGGKLAGHEKGEGELGKPRASDAAQYAGIASADIIQEGKGSKDIDVSAEGLKRDLANRQAQLVKRAEDVTKQFEQLFTPAADWFKGVDLMRQIEEEVRKGPSEKLWQLQEQALEKMKRVYREIAPGAAYDFDVGLNKTPNPLVLDPRPQEFPKRDEEALKQYYRRLAEDQ